MSTPARGMPWLVGRVKHGEITADQLNDIAEWLRTLDLDPNRFLACAAIVQHGTQYELHLTERVLDDRGGAQWDHAYDKAYTRPVIVSVDEGSWPAWLTGLDNATIKVNIAGGGPASGVSAGLAGFPNSVVHNAEPEPRTLLAMQAAQARQRERGIRS